MGFIFLHNSTFIQVAYGWCYLHKARSKWISLSYRSILLLITRPPRAVEPRNDRKNFPSSFLLFSFALITQKTRHDMRHNTQLRRHVSVCSMQKKRNNHKIYTRKKSVKRVMAMNVLNVHIYYFGSKRSNPIFARLTSSGRVFSCSFVSSKKTVYNTRNPRQDNEKLFRFLLTRR